MFCLHFSRRQFHSDFMFSFNMVLMTEDRILIKNLYDAKGCGAKKLIKEYPAKQWKLRSINRLLKYLRETGTADRRPGSGRPRSSRSTENIETGC